MAGSMSGREARAGESKPPVLRLAGDEVAERRTPVAIVVERPEARGRSEVDPMFSVALRAFLLDLGILGTSISLYIAVMINSGYLSTTGGDPADRRGADRVVAAADPPARWVRGALPGRRDPRSSSGW